MTNHPSRSTRSYQFIAYSTVTLSSLACGPDARSAVEGAVEGQRLPDTDFIEVLDCGSGGRKVWNEALLLPAARKKNRTVFRGAGYEPDLPAVKLEP